jgi:hypothetical protein
MAARKAEFEPFSFRSVIEQGGYDLGWWIAIIPGESEKRFGTKVMFNVRAMSEGESFQTTCFPTGTGQHFLMITNEMKRAFGLQLGMPFTFELENDPVPRTVEVPAEIYAVLEQQPALLETFENMAPSHRKYWIQQWQDAKSYETRSKRLIKMMEKLEEIRLQKDAVKAKKTAKS